MRKDAPRCQQVRHGVLARERKCVLNRKRGRLLLSRMGEKVEQVRIQQGLQQIAATVHVLAENGLRVVEGGGQSRIPRIFMTQQQAEGPAMFVGEAVQNKSSLHADKCTQEFYACFAYRGATMLEMAASHLQSVSNVIQVDLWVRAQVLRQVVGGHFQRRGCTCGQQEHLA